jgi:hypothetical protein
MGLEEARSSFKSQDDGLALEGGSVGLYVPLCKFYQRDSRVSYASGGWLGASARQRASQRHHGRGMEPGCSGQCPESPKSAVARRVEAFSPVLRRTARGNIRKGWPPLPGLRIGSLARGSPPPAGFEHPILIIMSVRRLPRPGPSPPFHMEVDPGAPRRALDRTTPWRSGSDAVRGGATRLAAGGKGSRFFSGRAAWIARRTGTMRTKRLLPPSNRYFPAPSTGSPTWSSTACTPNTPNGLTGGPSKALSPGTRPSRVGPHSQRPSFSSTELP